MESKRIRMWMLALIVVLMAAIPAGVRAADKVYELKFAWNDIWGPKFRAAQVYRPCGEMQRMLEQRSGGRIKVKIIPPLPPDRLVPPITTAAIASSSYINPASGSPCLTWHACNTPARPASPPQRA